MAAVWRRWCGLALACAVAMVEAGCGGGEGRGASTSPVTSASLPRDALEFDPVVVGTAELALERFGDLETAGMAIVAAYESGYSFDQIVAGVESGALEDAGVIDGVEPELDTARFAGMSARMPIRLGAPADMREILRRIDRAGDDIQKLLVLKGILEAVRLGVEAPKIIEAFVLGELFGLNAFMRCYEKSGEDEDACLEEAEERHGRPSVLGRDDDPAGDGTEGQPASAPETSPPVESSPASTDGVDGSYVGTVTPSGSVAEFVSVADSTVEVTIAQGTAAFRAEVTFEAVWNNVQDGPDCVATQRWVIAGSGPAPLDTLLATAESEEVLAISGCDPGERRAEDQKSMTVSITTVNGARISGTAGFFDFVAERQ